MARLVTKFKFLKSGDRKGAGGYAKYIATREGVERIDDSQRLAPATKQQETLIEKILKDFPDSATLMEYADYQSEPNMGNASEFIFRAIEDNADDLLSSKTYADYIATRPRAQRFGSHGLFTDDGVRVQLEKVSEELNLHEGNVWTAIISLRREDAERLGFNSGERWRDMLGYRKGEDGNPEIVPEEAAIVQRVFDMYLSGKSTDEISEILQAEKIVIPGKKLTFSKSMIIRMLKNEKYCGDAILQKTVTIDPISKKRKANEGEAPMWLVENSHPAIVTREIFNKAQEESARRKAKAPVSQKSAMTASGKYSKYALTEVMICGECGSRYKRVTWNIRGKRRIVWRCISRLDYGKKYCTESITVDEQALQRAIVRALNRFNVEDEATYLLLMKSTIGEAVGINGSSDEIDLLERRIDALNKRMLDLVSLSVQEGDDAENHEDDFKNISTQIEQLTKRITAIRESESENGDFQARLKEIQDIIDKRRENKDIYDDSIVRQMVECIKVYHDGRLQIILGGGYELEEYLEK